MDRYQGRLLVAHFVVVGKNSRRKGRQLGWMGQIPWYCQECEEHFLQDVSSKKSSSSVERKIENFNNLLCSWVVRLLFRESKTSLQLQLIFCLFWFTDHFFPLDFVFYEGWFKATCRHDQSSLKILTRASAIPLQPREWYMLHFPIAHFVWSLH